MAAMRLPLLFTQNSELPAAGDCRFLKLSEVLEVLIAGTAAPDVSTDRQFAYGRATREL